MPWFILLYSKQNIDLITGSLWCPFYVKNRILGKKFQSLAAHDSRSSEEIFQRGFWKGLEGGLSVTEDSHGDLSS